MKDMLKGIGIVMILYIMISGMAWQINNPKANQVTFWTHLPQALTFQKVSTFQE